MRIALAHFVKFASFVSKMKDKNVVYTGLSIYLQREENVMKNAHYRDKINRSQSNPNLYSRGAETHVHTRGAHL